MSAGRMMLTSAPAPGVPAMLVSAFGSARPGGLEHMACTQDEFFFRWVERTARIEIKLGQAGVEPRQSKRPGRTGAAIQATLLAGGARIARALRVGVALCKHTEFTDGLEQGRETGARRKQQEQQLPILEPFHVLIDPDAASDQGIDAQCR